MEYKITNLYIPNTHSHFYSFEKATSKERKSQDVRPKRRGGMDATMKAGLADAPKSNGVYLQLIDALGISSMTNNHMMELLQGKEVSNNIAEADSFLSFAKNLSWQDIPDCKKMEIWNQRINEGWSMKSLLFKVQNFRAQLYFNL